MDSKSTEENATDPPKSPEEDSLKKPEESPKVSSKKKKRKKHFRKPRKLFALIWWIITFIGFGIGGTGLVQLILTIYLRGGGPDWSYSLVITPLPREVQMVVYGFKGVKRELEIRMMESISFYELFEYDGVSKVFQKHFEEAQKLIPWLSRSSSPIYFAGADDMRLIRKDDIKKYNQFMEDLEKLFQKTELKLTPHSLRTLEDWEQALNGWITLNYLTDYMTKGRQPIKAKRNIFTTRFTLGGLDLGHTSLHVSYEIPRIIEGVELPPNVKERTRVITLYGREYYVYTQTLSCYGAIRIMEMYMGFKLYKWDLWWDIEQNFCFNEPHDRSANTNTAKSVIWSLHGSCSRSNWTRKFIPAMGGHDVERYGGNPNPEECLKEVKNMIENCTTYFTDGACPTFNFPERPYDVTFAGINEFATYALIAGMKDGDPKEEWDRKRKDICSLKNLKEIRKKYPSNTADRLNYQNLCLMMTFIYILLSEKIKLSNAEWSKLRILESVDESKISWHIGYIANSTNTLPTVTPFHMAVTLENVFWEGLGFSIILTISSITASFALRNSNILAMRPLQIPI